MAKSGAALGTAAITVQSMNTAPILTILEPGDGGSFPEGAAITFKASAGDLEDGDLNAAIGWTVASATDPDAPQWPLGTGATITSVLAPGSYLVTAGVTDSGGLGIVKQVGITVGCSIVASLTPESGLKIPQLLHLDASGSYDTCGRPLQYHWYCMSDTSTTCPSFNMEANANGSTISSPFLNLQPFDIISVGVKICAAGTTECAPRPSWAWMGDYSTQATHEGAPVTLTHFQQ